MNKKVSVRNRPQSNQCVISTFAWLG